MFNRLRFTPAWLGASERSELTEHLPSVAAEAMDSFIADGAGIGQHVTMLVKRKSRRWWDGDSKRGKAVTRLCRVTAWWSPRQGSRLQAASWRAGLSLASAVAQRRRAEGKAVIESTEPGRDCMRAGVVPMAMR